MNLFQSQNNIPPQKFNAELMHWQEGDELIAHDVKITNWFAKLTASETNTLKVHYYFKGFTKDGYIIVENKESGHLGKAPLKKFLKHAKNLSLQSRSLQNNLEDSKEYMELINQFQKAYNELQKSDNFSHRLEEPKSNQNES